MNNSTKINGVFIRKLFITIVVLLIVFGAVAVLYSLYNSLQEQNGIYVEYEGVTYSSTNSSNGLTIPYCETITFTVGSTSDWGVYSVQDCIVQIVPNVNDSRDFDFVVGDSYKSSLYSAVSDLSTAFSVNGGSITVSATGDFSIFVSKYRMSDILEAVYGETITIDEDYVLSDYPYIALMVTSPDNSSSITIPLLLDFDFHSGHNSSYGWVSLSQSDFNGGAYASGTIDGGSGSTDTVYYYLNGDIELTTDITINGNVTLCLNGNVLKGTGNSSVITVNSNAKLELCDCDTATAHTYSVDSDGTYVLCETGCSEEAHDHDSNVIYGGVITNGDGTYGGGVYVSLYGTFTMSGGTISGNTAVRSGGVFVSIYGSFVMSGGTISGNAANRYGGVYVSSFGSFTMSGGTISSNSGGACDGVYVSSNGAFANAGGKLDDICYED